MACFFFRRDSREGPLAVPSGSGCSAPDLNCAQKLREFFLIARLLLYTPVIMLLASGEYQLERRRVLKYK